MLANTEKSGDTEIMRRYKTGKDGRNMDMAEKNKITVIIAGREYYRVGEESQEYMQKVALYVARKIGEILRKNNRLSTAMAAMLTAINLADEFIRATDSEKPFKTEAKHGEESVKSLTENNKRLNSENEALKQSNIDLQFELVRVEAELSAMRKAAAKGPERH